MRKKDGSLAPRQRQGEPKESRELRDRIATLESQNKYLQAALDAVDDPIVIANADSQILVRNERARALLAAQESDSESRRRAIELNDRNLTAVLSAFAVSGERSAREVTLVDPIEGSDLPFEAVLHPVEDSQGRFLGVISTLRTDLKLAASELEKNYSRLESAEKQARGERDRLDLVLESVGDPIIVSDPSNRITRMNGRASILFASDLDPAADPSVARGNAAKLESFISNFIFDFSDSLAGTLDLVHPVTGKALPIEVVTGKIRDPRGQLTAVVSVLHDQTQLQENERLLEQVRRFNLDLERRIAMATRDLSAANRASMKKSEAVDLSNRELERINQVLVIEKHKLTAILESLGEGIIVTDTTGTIILANAAAGRILGVATADFTGHRLEEYVPVEYADALAKLSNLSGESGAETCFERLNFQRSGKFLQANCLPMLDAGAIVTGLVHTIRDVTVEHQVDQMKSDFLSVVSHELRTPLTSIRGSLQLAVKRSGGGLPAGTMRYIDISLRNTDRLIRLINDILDISRLESGKVEIVLAAHSIPDLVEFALGEIRQLAREKEIDIQLGLAPGLPPVWVDGDRMVQVLINLLNNAVKYSPEQSTILLSVQRAGADAGVPRNLGGRNLEDFAFVEVADQGPGIAADDQERMFNRFEQLDSGDTRASGGAGLGLTISKELVERMGGFIWVESELGGGSRFRFIVPFRLGA